MTWLWLAVAGGLGVVARYGVYQLFEGRASTGIPWATLVINVVGSFAIGVAMARFATRGELDSRLRLLLTTGFLGGFTTYSAFALETLTLLERRNLFLAALYVALTLVLALAGCAAGVLLGRRL